MKAASSFDPFSLPDATLTMANLTRPPILVSPDTTYRDYLYCANTNTFYVCYYAVLVPYEIDTTTAVVTPAKVTRLIYSAAQEVIPTNFLQ